MVYQFKEMPKNIIIIDDKADMSDDLMASDTAVSYERVPPPSDMLLQASELPPSKKPNILRGASRASVVQTSVAASNKSPPGGGATVTTAGPRIVAVSSALDGSQQSHPAGISNAAGPR